jgi:hypothetical protein
MAADPSVIRKWENEHHDPSVEVWPRILKFLGFYPYPTLEASGPANAT